MAFTSPLINFYFFKKIKKNIFRQDWLQRRDPESLKLKSSKTCRRYLTDKRSWNINGKSMESHLGLNLKCFPANQNW